MQLQGREGFSHVEEFTISLDQQEKAEKLKWEKCNYYEIVK